MQDHDTIPYGYCHCGCGGKTKIATMTSKKYGAVKGQPRRYINGHHSAINPARLVTDGEKTCPRCMRTLDVSSFGRDNRARDKRTVYCKECRSGLRREWRRGNPLHRQAESRNYRAAKSGSVGRVSVREWEEILAEFDGKCAKCGTDEYIEMDHIIPLSKGGAHTRDNVQPLCRQCNNDKMTNIEDYRTNKVPI